MRNTGTIYAVFKSAGRTRWKNLGTDDVNQARELLAGEMKQEAKVDSPFHFPRFGASLGDFSSWAAQMHSHQSVAREHFRGAPLRCQDGDIPRSRHPPLPAVDKLKEIFGTTQETDEDRQESKAPGTVTNADLYKMHTYNEAIRRTVGSYVLYPGTDSQGASVDDAADPNVSDIVHLRPGRPIACPLSEFARCSQLTSTPSPQPQALNREPSVSTRLHCLPPHRAHASPHKQS